MGLVFWDYVVLAVYFIGITGAGVFMARKIKSTEDYFLGGRKFGTALLLMHTFGSATDATQAVQVSSKTFTDGVSGLWTQGYALFVTPLYWIMAPIFSIPWLRWQAISYLWALCSEAAAQ